MKAHTDPPRAPHVFPVAVRWSDEDRLGHVNNTRYLTFTEDARLVWLAGSPTGAGSVILARAEIDFRFPVHFPTGGRLEVRTSVLGIGRSSVRVRQDVCWPPGATPEPPAQVAEPVAATRHVLVCYDYAAGAPRPWTDAERAWLEQWSEGGEG